MDIKQSLVATIIGLVSGLISSFLVALSFRSFPLNFIVEIGDKFYLIENNRKKIISLEQSKILELKFGPTMTISWISINFLQGIIIKFLPTESFKEDFVKLVKVKNDIDVYVITSYSRHYLQDKSLLKKYNLDNKSEEKWPMEKIERFPLGRPILKK